MCLHRPDAVRALHRFRVDPKTREQRFAISTSAEFLRIIHAHSILSPLCSAIPTSTLKGWFVYAGQGNAAKQPVPKPTFTTGLNAGYNSEFRKSTGRPTLLEGCKDELEAFSTELQHVVNTLGSLVECAQGLMGVP